MNRSEKVKEIIAEEIFSWKMKHKEVSISEQIKIRKAINVLMLLSGKPDEVTVGSLRKEYGMHKKRSETAELPDRELDIIARNRAAKACKAIAVLGKRIKELDEGNKK